MAWIDLMPRHCIVAILDKHFFPKWLKVLSAWLTSTPNYEEVTNWYRGWKTMFPDVLLADTTIKGQLEGQRSGANISKVSLVANKLEQTNKSEFSSGENKFIYL